MQSPSPATTVDTGGANLKYNRWTLQDEALLADWLTTPGNYVKWKNSGRPVADGKMASTGDTKIKIAQGIQEYLARRRSTKSVQSIKMKIQEWERKFWEAEAYLATTGEGLTSIEEMMGISAIKEKVLSKFKYYDMLEGHFGNRAGNRPLFLSQAGGVEDESLQQGLLLADELSQRSERDHSSSSNSCPEILAALSDESEPEDVPPVDDDFSSRTPLVTRKHSRSSTDVGLSSASKRRADLSSVIEANMSEKNAQRAAKDRAKAQKDMAKLELQNKEFELRKREFEARMESERLARQEAADAHQRQVELLRLQLELARAQSQRSLASQNNEAI
ncbi:hypothetical protein DFJ77DRAFT_440626 [Powellomyces hirtus]|nr:hypothetical protein DFJ77DRAFT_440626 [Powellomyces hirtus]